MFLQTLLEKRAIEDLLNMSADEFDNEVAHDFKRVDPKPIKIILKRRTSVDSEQQTNRCPTEFKTKCLFYRPAQMRPVLQDVQSPRRLSTKQSTRVKSTVKTSVVKLSKPILVQSLTDRVLNPVLKRRQEPLKYIKWSSIKLIQ